jgi:hypothetical protein
MLFRRQLTLIRRGGVANIGLAPGATEAAGGYTFFGNRANEQ